MVAVAAGRGLWAAITARGDALLCIFPCLALVRLDGSKLGGSEDAGGGVRRKKGKNKGKAKGHDHRATQRKHAAPPDATAGAE